MDPVRHVADGRQLRVAGRWQLGQDLLQAVGLVVRPAGLAWRGFQLAEKPSQAGRTGAGGVQPRGDVGDVITGFAPLVQLVFDEVLQHQRVVHGSLLR